MKRSIKTIIVVALSLLVLATVVVAPVSAQPQTHTQAQTIKQVQTIYVWTNGTMSLQLRMTVFLLSLQYNVQVKPYAGNNAARMMYGVMSAPAMTILYSNGDVQHPIDNINLYGSNMNYLNVLYVIRTNYV